MGLRWEKQGLMKLKLFVGIPGADCYEIGAQELLMGAQLMTFS